MASPRRLLMVALVALALTLTACGSAPRTSGDGPSSDQVYAVSAAPRTRVVAVGDIACPPGGAVTATTCRQADTAALTRRINPDLVLTLGDHQYQKASPADFAASYDASWGSLLSKTRPVIGNHEYYTAGATGYYSYFKDRQPGPPGYYRVTASGWNIYLLNSNCDRISCAAEASWLNSQMAAHPSKCSLIAMHHPRYSSGLEHGNNTAVKGLWSVAYNRRNDVVLSGHDHDYERFKPMDAFGHVKPYRGMTEFVSGTGGKNLYRLGTRKKGSVYFQARTHGVLVLDLKAGAFSWGYRDLAGRLLDSGTRYCR